MIKISEKLLKNVLGPGVVVYLSNPGRLFSSDFHYHIILNTPTQDCDYLLVLVTSQITINKKIIEKSGWSPSTLIEVSPAECSFLKKPSAVNCNNVFAYSVKELKEMYDAGQINLAKGSTVSPAILSKLRKAVLKSEKVEKFFQIVIENEQ